ncbi:MAG: DUF6481 family protein [Acetobacteraceae bacterium]|jgi:Family of unknown function (DUF6481)
MKSSKRDTFNDRLSTAAEAKAAQLAKFRAKPAPDSPEALERQAELQAIASAREARNVERWAARAAEAAKLAAEERARAAEEAARAAEEKARAAAAAQEQKAARDARYAARRARRK